MYNSNPSTEINLAQLTNINQEFQTSIDDICPVDSNHEPKAKTSKSSEFSEILTSLTSGNSESEHYAVLSVNGTKTNTSKKVAPKAWPLMQADTDYSTEDNVDYGLYTSPGTDSNYEDASDDYDQEYTTEGSINAQNYYPLGVYDGDENRHQTIECEYRVHQ